MAKRKPEIRQVLANALELKVYSPYRGTETTDDPGKVIVPIGAVRRDPNNAMLHPEKNIRGIRASLRRRGQVKPIVVGPDGIILAGNGNHESAELEGWQYIWIVTTGLVGMEAKGYALADNQTARSAEWHTERRDEQLSELRAWAPDDDDTPPMSDDDLGGFDEPLPIGDPDDTYSQEQVPEPKKREKKPREVKPPPPDADDRATSASAINGVTPNMRITIDAAIERCRLVCADMAITEGRCIELICADYLAGN